MKIDFVTALIVLSLASLWLPLIYTWLELRRAKRGILRDSVHKPKTILSTEKSAISRQDYRTELNQLYAHIEPADRRAKLVDVKMAMAFGEAVSDADLLELQALASPKYDDDVD